MTFVHQNTKPSVPCLKHAGCSWLSLKNSVINTPKFGGNTGFVVTLPLHAFFGKSHLKATLPFFRTFSFPYEYPQYASLIPPLFHVNIYGVLKPISIISSWEFYKSILLEAQIWNEWMTIICILKLRLYTITKFEFCFIS